MVARLALAKDNASEDPSTDIPSDLVASTVPSASMNSAQQNINDVIREVPREGIVARLKPDEI